MDRFYSRWLLLVLGLLFVFVGLGSLPSAIHAARHDGTWGVFTATDRHCSRGGCLWDGTFRSDNGAIVQDEVTYDGHGIDHVGDRVRAEVVKGSSDAYGRHSDALLESILFSIGGVVCLVWWEVLRRRRAVSGG
ncbi:hypothetical protein [Nocardioides marmorisolisilvae]|nr:hypothetical protein [Nocardioides marmorisolisilvae]